MFLLYSGYYEYLVVRFLLVCVCVRLKNIYIFSFLILFSSLLSHITLNQRMRIRIDELHIFIRKINKKKISWFSELCEKTSSMFILSFISLAKKEQQTTQNFHSLCHHHHYQHQHTTIIVWSLTSHESSCRGRPGSHFWNSLLSLLSAFSSIEEWLNVMRQKFRKKLTLQDY